MPISHFVTFVASLVGTASLCRAALPALRRAFLVTPVARSSHVEATPQGGGVIVAPLALAIAWFALLSSGWKPERFGASLTLALLALVVLGCRDDLVGLSARFRFVVQTGAAGLALATLPAASQPILGWLPPFVAALILVVGVLWFINLTNFMDGIDLISVTQFVPAFVTIAWLLPGDSATGLVCVAFAGALVGFATLNRPPARLFLGDSGSLPLGLLGAAGALVVAGERGIIVAALPFAYYAADATLTLARRALAGEKVWEAHKQHFYQRALQRLTIGQIVLRVGACNVLLCGAAVIVANQGVAAHYAAVVFGAGVVALLLRDLGRERT